MFAVGHVRPSATELAGVIVGNKWGFGLKDDCLSGTVVGMWDFCQTIEH